MSIHAISPDDVQARGLIEQSDQYMASLYPPESNHLEDVEALKKPNVLFVGQFVGDELAGFGAVKIMSDEGEYGEIKRLFVLPAHRRQGISCGIVNYLENQLVTSGVQLARLETGVRQPEALCLYRKLGYLERIPFGAYREDPLSIFMEKALPVER